MSKQTRSFDNTSPADQSPLMTIKEFLNWSRRGRTSTYKDVAAGRLQLVKIGKRSFVTRDEARRWLASAIAESTT